MPEHVTVTPETVGAIATAHELPAEDEPQHATVELTTPTPLVVFTETRED